MDFLKNAMNKNKASSSTSGTSGTAKTGQKDDYLDKAWDFASKKGGKDFDKGTDEKITDGMRSAYEKATG